MSPTSAQQKPLRLVLAVAVAASLAGAAVWTWRTLHWPIEVVRIDSAVVNADRQRLRQTVSRHARAGFFGVDLAELRVALVDLPWVREASLRRVWPDQLRVEIVEHEVAATWNGDALLSVRGAVFTPDAVTGYGVPALEGPQNLGPAMLERLRAIESRLAGVGLAVRALEQDARRAWRLRLDNDVVLRLGRDDVMTRLERFVAVWPRALRQRADAVAAVDLRYTNGLAVSWSGEVPEGAAAATADQGADDV